MATTRLNDLDPFLDIKGISEIDQNKILIDESNKFGTLINNGSTANVTTNISGTVTVSGLSGLNNSCIGNILVISNSVNNDGAFLITNFINASTIEIFNLNSIPNDPNNGSITWEHRKPYTIQDNINFSITDRKLIKGTTNWYDVLPTYQRPTSIGSNIDVNLSNISGKTTDALGFIFPRKINTNVNVGSNFITISSVGSFQHSDSVNKTGVPLFDTAPYINDFNACYILVLNPSNNSQMKNSDGYVIFGLSRKGNAIDGNSIEVVWKACYGVDLNQSIDYVWEVDKPTNVNLFYGYFSRLDQSNEIVFQEMMKIASIAFSSGADGVAGGDLSGTYPNPSVIDLTIPNQVQGSMLYFNGTNWVQLSPGNDGYVLSSHGTGTNPTWEKQSDLLVAGSGQFVIYDALSGQYVAANAMINEANGNILINNSGKVIFED